MRDIEMIAMVSVLADGTVRVGDGTTSVLRNAAGVYTLSYEGEFPDDEVVIFANPAVANTGLPCPAFEVTVPGTVVVNTFGADGSLVDQPWNMVIYRVDPA